MYQHYSHHDTIVANLRTFWCASTGLNNLVVSQNRQISDMHLTHLNGFSSLCLRLWLWLWLWFCTAVNEPKPSLNLNRSLALHHSSTSGVSSGKVIPMKNFPHSCKYSTGEDLTLLGARDAIATASLRECTMCAASLAIIDEFYIISRIY